MGMEGVDHQLNIFFNFSNTIAKTSRLLVET